MTIGFACGRAGRGRRVIDAVRSVRAYSSKLGNETKKMSTLPALNKDAAEVKKIGGPAGWTKDELLANKWWGYQLPEAALAELDDAVKHAYSSSLEWADDIPLNVTKEKFPLKGMGDIIAEMSDELENGAGAAMLANIPVEKYTIPELSVLYLGICAHLLLQLFQLCMNFPDCL